MSLPFKVIDEHGIKQGETARPEEAAALVDFLGRGAAVRVHGRIVWREGAEEQSAGESYDFAAGVMLSRSGLK